MKVVYALALELATNPERVSKTQAMTLNANKPFLGLRGAHGLFASPDWWTNLSKGLIATEVRAGTIEKLSFAGQDARWGEEVNSFSMRADDGALADESIVVNAKSDRRLFKVGACVQLRYALDELKKQPGSNGAVNYARVLLEVSVSPAP